MAWWGWLLLGFGLAAAELLGIEAAFYLIFVGAAAILMGLAGMAGLDLPAWGQFLSFGVLAVASMILFRRKLYDRMHRESFASGPALVGETVEAPENLDPGGHCRVRLRGSTWDAENAGMAPLQAGQRARVIAVEGTLLKVEGPGAP